MSNKYNVLVDMEDAAYTQPATIESDGLEFQGKYYLSAMHLKFSLVNQSSAPPPPPLATAAASSNAGFFDSPQQQRNTTNGKPIWSVEYYAQFFDVDTTQVIDRCLKSMYPVGDYAADTLQNQPDLYGPFWIATSVVFFVFVCSSLAGSLAAYIAGKPHVYDFTLLSFAVVVVYMYAFLCPALVWASTKYFGCQPSLLEIINYYGYGLTIWIPVSRQQKIWERERKEAEAKKKTAASYVNQSPFRYAERNFKSRVPPPDFSQVVDFEKIEDHSDIIVPVQLTEDLRRLSSVFGRCETPCRDAFVLKNVPGLIIIPNAFTPVAQRSLIKQCMSVYPRPPNTSNLDTHYVIPETGLWPLYEAQENEALKPTDPGYFVPKKVIASDAHTDTSSDEDDADIEEAKEEPKMAPTACSDDFKPVTDNPKPDPLPAPGVPLLSPAELVRKMRWITLGYQYHWPTKTYHFDRRYPFPADVSELTKAVVTAVENIGYDDGNGNAWMNQYKGQNFNAEAGVINYYQYRDTLMGHVDRSEVNMEAPLVSLRYRRQVALERVCI
ncbi:hypothetical protein BD408DRAFT_355921 [Parasitella parasitica]|nr:hypothetical protein BD408DRAFT_355921 [Parasitella parasitica]